MSKALTDLLKSKRFWIVLFTAILDIAIILTPALEPSRDVLVQAITALAMLLVGGFSAQDYAVARAQGTSKYHVDH